VAGSSHLCGTTDPSPLSVKANPCAFPAAARLTCPIVVCYRQAKSGQWQYDKIPQQIGYSFPSCCRTLYVEENVQQIVPIVSADSLQQSVNLDGSPIWMIWHVRLRQRAQQRYDLHNAFNGLNSSNDSSSRSD
jgi:hypothetical protein